MNIGEILSFTVFDTIKTLNLNHGILNIIIYYAKCFIYIFAIFVSGRSKFIALTV